MRAGSAKLGVIGGRKAKSTTSRLASPAEALTVAEEDNAGAISLDTVPSQRSQHNNDVPPVNRGRSYASEQDPIQQPSEPRESSQDRANRRREELKRQLAIQASGAVKKKRKF